MVEQAKQISKGLWEANQELAEEIAHEIYELRDEPENTEPEVTKNCESCRFWNMPEVTEMYGENVCSQYRTAKFNRRDKALVKLTTQSDFSCILWEDRYE